MKRILALLLGVSMVFGFAACGKDEKAEKRKLRRHMQVLK